MLAKYAIEVKELSKKFRAEFSLFRPRRPKKYVFKDVSFRVKEGEVFGLVGKNASGKTTLAKILSTILLPTRGDALVGGYSIINQMRKVRGIIGFVSGQERDFGWRLSGRENLDFFSALHNISFSQSSKRISVLANLLGIEQYLDIPFSEYSSGVRQRFSIAKGLLHEPRIIFMDEPTKSLDDDIIMRLRIFIREKLIKKEGKTVFITMPDSGRVSLFTDRIAFLENGSVIVQNTK